MEVHFDFWNVVYPSGSFYDIKLGSLVVSEDEGKLHQFKAQVTQFRTKSQFRRLKVDEPSFPVYNAFRVNTSAQTFFWKIF